MTLCLDVTCTTLYVTTATKTIQEFAKYSCMDGVCKLHVHTDICTTMSKRREYIIKETTEYCEDHVNLGRLELASILM